MTESDLGPTGRPIVIEAAGVRAEIGTVAAVLRALTVHGVAVTEPLPANTPPPMAAGIVLAPWPNRVRDGLWSPDGHPQQLDLTEVARRNAIHGLLRNTDYTVREQHSDQVTLGALVPPQHGWPFLLDTWVRYTLRPDGLQVTHGAVNHGDRRAPFAVGAHPYVRIGDHPVEDLTLTVHAATYFEVDDRMNPIAENSVSGTGYDLRDGRRVTDLDLDTTFGAVHHQRSAVAVLRAPDGVVELLQDDDWGYVQVFTPRTFPGRPVALALEPMTAPPDALNSGAGLHWLEPGASWSGSWGIRYTPADEGRRVGQVR